MVDVRTSIVTGGTNVVAPENLHKVLDDLLFKFDKQNKKSADAVIKEAGINMFGSVIEETPVGDSDPDHEGTLKGGWDVTTGAPSDQRFADSTPNRTRADIKADIPNHIISKKINVFMTNNEPYINIVEFGGYTKSPQKGTFNKRTGQFEIRSAGGFSKQAPAGMVRRNTSKWKRFVEIAANKIL